VALDAAGGKHGPRSGMVDGVGLGGLFWAWLLLDGIVGTAGHRSPNEQTAQQAPRKPEPAGNADCNGLT
jgi:hypothetical protein